MTCKNSQYTVLTKRYKLTRYIKGQFNNNKNKQIWLAIFNIKKNFVIINLAQYHLLSPISHDVDMTFNTCDWNSVASRKSSLSAPNLKKKKICSNASIN